MELREVLQQRRSIRKYKPDPVSETDIIELVDAARLAPSALNVQPWRVVIVKNQDMRHRIAQTTNSRFVGDAPVVIVCCTDIQAFDTLGIRIDELRKAGAFAETSFSVYESGDFFKNQPLDMALVKANLEFNTAIAIENLILKATELGLGSCWVGAFDSDAVREVLGLDERYQIKALVPIGYPAQDPAPRPRLPWDDIVLKKI